MDKRTFFFVLAMVLSLFGVNMFFDHQRQDSLREWTEKHKGTLLRKEQQLEAEVAAHTVAPASLPLVELYGDKEGKSLLAMGIQDGQSVATMAWSAEMPATVYGRKSGSSEPLRELIVAYTPKGIGGLLIYQPYSEGKILPLSIGDLPDFGSYYLQLFDPANPQVVTLATYTDGHLAIPAKRIAQLKRELEPDKPASQFEVKLGNAIALMQTPNGLLPVALYQAQADSLFYLEEDSSIATTVVKAENKPVVAAGERPAEKFYVIETPYQQLVFSSYGGALAEINLPFASDTNQQSVVREIEFDRLMVQQHPQNARFPSHPYTTFDKKEHAQGSLGGYYPLIRRDLILSGNRKSIRIAPRYYSLNIVSEYPEVAELVYTVKKFDAEHIVFESSQSHRRITKTYSISDKAPYCLNLAIKIEGDGRGLWLTSGVPEVEWISGSPAPALKYRVTRNQKADVVQIDLPKDSLTVTTTNPDWICNSNGFLGLIQDSLSHDEPGYRAQYVSGTVVPSRLVEIDTANSFKAQDLPGYVTLLPLKTGSSMNFRIFAGPFATNILQTVDAIYTDPLTGYTPDYIASQSFHGWFAFISEPFAKFLLILMNFFYSITSSWGFSIILLTVALRVMMYPLNAWSNKSMLKMQQIAPEVAAIQERYKKDPKQAQLEIMNLYRERGVNPMSGCLPMLIQMPFLIGMFDLLKSTFELRGASFVPGWIDNLAAPDVLFSWTTPIFFIGNQFHLLPILLGVVMFLQQRLMSPAPKDPSQLTDQQRQQRAMGSIMAVVFMLMFYHFPSGLNIYWLSSMLLGILQQWWTTVRMKTQQTVAASSTKTTKKKA